MRTATKSKAKMSAPVDETGAIVPSQGVNGKGKERASEEHPPEEKSKSRSRMLSKVSFRRPAARESQPPAPVPPVPREAQGARADKDRDKNKARVAGKTSFLTPSLRQASMSSPALPIPSAYTQPFALPGGSTTNVAALGSPPRERSRRTESGGLSARDIGGPQPLTPRRDSRGGGGAGSPREGRRPPPLSLSSRGSGSPGPETPTPTRRSRDHTRSPEPPSPTPRGLGSSRRAAASANHLPLHGTPSPPVSPTLRPISPSQARSSSRTPTRLGPSASSSHLPLGSSTSASARRPSLDAPRPSIEARRPSVEARRPSVEARRPSLDARRPSLDLSRSSLEGRRPSLDRAGSPVTPTRPRALSPTHPSITPNYYQNKLLNASTTSLGVSSNTEHREQIRTASSYLCKEMLKPPSKLNDSSLQPRQWEEVEMRMRNLARLERVWGKSGGGMGSSSQLSSIGGMSSSGLSASGEERERRLFTEALRDGFVLCQYVDHSPFIRSACDN